MTEIADVVVIGAGGAGLATSYHLSKLGVSHLILERGRVGNTWEKERWDSFTLVNPNWAIRLPDFRYETDNPDGYLPRDEVVNYLRRYAASFNAPVREGVAVEALVRVDGCYRLATSAGPVEARVVIVATGAFGVPNRPAFADRISPRVTQLHSSEYRSATALPEGAVLVVGSAQSGAQIAEDLLDSGRKVFLSASRVGRRPRRYRGHDSSWWNNEMGSFDRTVDDIPKLDVRFASSSHTSGTKGGHTIYLRALARDGVTLIGRLMGAEGESIQAAPDLYQSLAYADKHAINWKRAVDRFIEETGMTAPEDDEPDPPDLLGYPSGDPPTNLDLLREGISTIIWATGFRYDYSWIHLPVTGDRGYPIQSRGVTAWPGLYFVGLQWMYSAKSAQFIGVGEDAEYVARHIAARPARA